MVRRRRSTMLVRAAIAAASMALTLAVARAASSGAPAARQDDEDFNPNPEHQICPLSDENEQKAPKAFAAMMPTFTHPRCLNCHGGVKPWLQNGGHTGGPIKPRDPTTYKEQVDGTDTGIPRDFVLPRTPQECQDCHSGLPGWSIPRPGLWFVGKDAVRLCMQIKEFEGNLNLFSDHVENELPIKFIAEAFKGARALDENGKATLLNVTGREFRNDPPPIPFAEFARQARAWVSAMVTPPNDGMQPWQMFGTCGCVPHRYALEMTYRQTYVKDAGSGVQEAQTISMPLRFGEDNRFSGEATVQTVQKVTIAGCARDGHYTRRFEASGRVPDETPRGTIDLKLVESVSGSLETSACSSKDVKVLPATETFPAITIKARLGATKSVDLGPPGTKLDIKVVKLQ